MPGLLVVDDTEIIRSTIANIVIREQLGMTPVIEALNGDEAVRLARLHQPDIVFMDIKMPGLNGLQATSVIRQENPRVKIVMLTAYDEFSYVQEALKLGAVDYLLKPVRPNKIIEIIVHLREVIEKEQLKRQMLLESQQRLETALPLVEAALVDDLIFRQTPDQPQFEATLRQLDKAITMPVAMVVSLDDFNKIVKRFKPQLLRAHTEAINMAVCQTLDNTENALIGQWQLGQLTVILSTATKWASVEEQINLGEAIRDRVARQAHARVTVSFGRHVSDIESVPDSYAEARLAQRHASVGNCVIHIQDVSLESHQHGYLYPLTLEKELLENVRLKQEEICLELMNEIVDDLLYKYRRDRQTLYSYFAELLTLVSRTLIEIGAPSPEVLDLSQQQMSTLFTSPSPVQLRAWALNSLTELMATVEFDVKQTNQDAVQLAIEYIHKHHQNPAISLTEIARTVGLSPSHLAYLLRERVGANYSRYLLSLRIKHAKKLLRTTTMTVSAIADMVGYPNPSNFYRIFRRETRQTPKVYRETKLRHQ